MKEKKAQSWIEGWKEKEGCAERDCVRERDQEVCLEWVSISPERHCQRQRERDRQRERERGGGDRQTDGLRVERRKAFFFHFNWAAASRPYSRQWQEKKNVEDLL